MAFELGEHGFGVEAGRFFEETFGEAEVVVLDAVVFASSNGQIEASVYATCALLELVPHQRL